MFARTVPKSRCRFRMKKAAIAALTANPANVFQSRMRCPIEIAPPSGTAYCRGVSDSGGLCLAPTVRFLMSRSFAFIGVQLSFLFADYSRCRGRHGDLPL